MREGESRFDPDKYLRGLQSGAQNPSRIKRALGRLLKKKDEEEERQNLDRELDVGSSTEDELAELLASQFPGKTIPTILSSGKRRERNAKVKRLKRRHK